MPPLSPERLALLRAALAAKGMAVPAPTAIARRAPGTPAPLTTAQERLYFLELFEPGTALHNDTLAVRIEGELDVARLERAFERIQARHEVLRCRIRLGADGAVHEPVDPVELPLRARILTREFAGKSALRVAEEDARKPFDLENELPWRVVLASEGPDRWLVALTMHHIVSDGASMGVFMDELSELYAADADVLPELSVQYGDYAVWERARAAARDAARDEGPDLEYWKRTLGGVAPLAWKQASGKADRTGAQVPLRFGRESSGRMDGLARAKGTTTNQLLLTAWFALLHSASGATDLRTGTASSTRKQRELQGLIGFFVQSVVLRADLGGDPTFLQALIRVRAAALEADAHAELPLDRVVRALEPATDADTLLRTFFSHMRDAIRAPRFEGTRASWSFVDPGVSRFDLSLILHEGPEGVTGFLEYDLGLFAPAAAEDLAAGYARIVQAVLDDPDVRLSRLAGLCAQEESGARRILPFPIKTRNAEEGS